MADCQLEDMRHHHHQGTSVTCNGADQPARGWKPDDNSTVHLISTQSDTHVRRTRGLLCEQDEFLFLSGKSAAFGNSWTPRQLFKTKLLISPYGRRKVLEDQIAPSTLRSSALDPPTRRRSVQRI